MRNSKKMKFRTFAFLIGMLLVCPSMFAQAEFDNEILSVYILDSDGPVTNLRDKPKGAVVGQIPTTETVILNLDMAENGWWHLVNGEVWTVENDSIIVVNDGDAWIHNSVLGVATRNYGGERLNLREAPNETSKVAHSFSEEIQVRPIDITGEWVRVKTLDGKHSGWIQREWLCGNPLTNCN